MEQTAVEWLINQVEDFCFLIPVDIIEEAKEMEKQQIIDAYKSDRYPCSDDDAEEYYNETFKK
jgi:hypothetical protein